MRLGNYLTRHPSLALLCFSLLLRLAYAAWLYPEVLPSDAGEYWREAGRLAAGEGLSLYWPPVLPAYLATWRMVWGDAPWVAVLASLVIWGAFFALLAQLSCRAPRRDRFALLLGFSLYPTFIHQSVVPLSYLPSATLLLGALALWRWSDRWRALSGLTWGSLALLRPATLVLLPAWLLDGWRWKSWGMGLLLAALLVAGWQAYLQHRDAGVFLNHANSYNFFLGNQPETPNYRSWWLGSHYVPDSARFQAYYARLDRIRALPRPQQDEAFRQAAWQHIAEHPAQFAYRLWQRYKVFWAYDVLAAGTVGPKHPQLGLLLLGGDVMAYVLLVGLSLLALWQPQPWPPGQRLLMGLLLLYPLPYLLAFSHPSFHLPLLPLLGLLILARSPCCTGLSRARRGGFLFSLLALLAIQVEWTLDLAARLGQ